MAQWEAVRAKRTVLAAEARGNGHAFTLRKVERSPYGRAHLRARCAGCGAWLDVVEFSDGTVSGWGGMLRNWCSN